MTYFAHTLFNAKISVLLKLVNRDLDDQRISTACQPCV